MFANNYVGGQLVDLANNIKKTKHGRICYKRA